MEKSVRGGKTAWNVDEIWYPGLYSLSLQKTKTITSPEHSLIPMSRKQHTMARQQLSQVVFSSHSLLYYTSLRKHVWECSAHFSCDHQTAPMRSVLLAGKSLVQMDNALAVPKVNGNNFKFSETPFFIAHKLSYLLM